MNFFKNELKSFLEFMPLNAKLAKFQFLDLNLTAKYELLLAADQNEFSEDSFSQKRESISIPKLFDEENHEDQGFQSNTVIPKQVPFPAHHHHSKANSKKATLDSSFTTLEASSKSGRKDFNSENNYDVVSMTSYNNNLAKNDIDILKNKSFRKKSDADVKNTKNSVDSCKESAFAELTNGMKYGSLESGKLEGNNNYSENNSNGIELQDTTNSNRLNIQNSGTIFIIQCIKVLFIIKISRKFWL